MKLLFKKCKPINNIKQKRKRKLDIVKKLPKDLINFLLFT